MPPCFVRSNGKLFKLLETPKAYLTKSELETINVMVARAEKINRIYKKWEHSLYEQWAISSEISKPIRHERRSTNIIRDTYKLKLP